MERVPRHRVYDTMKMRAFVFDGRMILDVDAPRKIGFKVTTIGRGDKHWRDLRKIIHTRPL